MAIAAVGTAMLLGLSGSTAAGSLVAHRRRLDRDLARAGAGHHARDRAHRGQRPAGAGRRRHRDVGDERRAGRCAGNRDPRQHRHGGVPDRGRRVAPVRDPGGRPRTRRATRSAARSRSRRRSPATLGAALVAAAQTAFVDALHFVAAVAAILAAATAIIVSAALWNVPARSEPAVGGRTWSRGVAATE